MTVAERITMVVESYGDEGITAGDIVKSLVGVPHNQCTNALYTLWCRGDLRRTGTCGHYRYYPVRQKERAS